MLEPRFWYLVSRNQVPERLKHLSDSLAKKIVRFQRHGLSTAIVRYPPIDMKLINFRFFFRLKFVLSFYLFIYFYHK